MRRKQLAVGATVYYDRSASWREYGTGGQKVTVEAVEPHEDRRASWNQPHDFQPTPDGTGHTVLVRFDDGKQGLVLLSQLRGPYDATKADVDAWIAARQQRTLTIEQRAAVMRGARQQAITHAGARGLYAMPAAGEPRRVSIPIRQLEAVLRALPDGWKCPVTDPT